MSKQPIFIRSRASSNVAIQCACHSPKTLPEISGIDYCSLFGNLLDNAIEAEVSSQIAEPELHVNLELVDNRLSVYVRNRIADSVLKDNPKLLTKKEQSQNHGYGVATVRKNAEKYNGMVDFYEDNGWFIAYVELYVE